MNRSKNRGLFFFRTVLNTPNGVAVQHFGVRQAMLFTAGQMRMAFGLSKQQWRSYRSALAPLTRDQGRSACFSATDLLAMTVIHRVSTGLSIPLNVFAILAEPLFQLLAACPWPQLERSILSIDVEQSRVELVDGDGGISSTTVTLLVDLAPMIAELRGRLLAGVPDPQRDLAFPPMIAKVRR